MLINNTVIIQLYTGNLVSVVGITFIAFGHTSEAHFGYYFFNHFGQGIPYFYHFQKYTFLNIEQTTHNHSKHTTLLWYFIIPSTFFYSILCHHSLKAISINQSYIEWRMIFLLTLTNI